VGKTPIDLALKPDGGELFVSNFDASSISVIETNANEVGATYLIGANPVRAVVSADNSLLFVSNFGADSVSIFSINDGKLVASIPVGRRPDALALTPGEDFLLAADSLSGDVAVIRMVKLPRGNKISLAEAVIKGQNPSKPQALFTMIPVGMQPNAMVVKQAGR
jgi:YVTN family beta-propeller protein